MPNILILQGDVIVKKFFDNNKKSIVFALYILVTLCFVLMHNNWRDEAQAWLIARDCSILELISQMKYEGHFIVWYLILMPFAKLGFPYITTNIMSLLITALAVWFIIYKAPFKFYNRVLIICLYPLIYLCPVVSRCYCLIPLAIVLMSIFYKDRKEKPFRFLLSVVLLTNTHVIMLGMVLVVMLEFMFELICDIKQQSIHETKNRIVSFFIAGILELISILPLFGCFGTNKEVEHNLKVNILQILTSLGNSLYDNMVQVNSFYYINPILRAFLIALLLCALGIALWHELKRYPMVYLKIGICIMYQFIIYAFIWPSISHRACTIIFIVLYYKWTSIDSSTGDSQYKKANIANACWIVLAIINIFGSIAFITYDYECKTSHACDIGCYINNYLDTDITILTGSMLEFASGIIPYVDKNIKFYHIPSKTYFTYTVWNGTNLKKIYADDMKNLINCFDKTQKLYYCTRQSIDTTEGALIKTYEKNGVLEKIYSTDRGSLYSEDYILYAIDLNKIR